MKILKTSNPLSLFGVLAKSLSFLFLLHASHAAAGTQAEETLSGSIRTAMCQQINKTSDAESRYGNEPAVQNWLSRVRDRFTARFPDARERDSLLTTIHYEAIRAGLDPQLILGLIHHESGFKRYAVSSAGALGYMQVMPFWLKQLGGCFDQFQGSNPLFHAKANIRFGTVILRHYLNIENGDLFRALGRYNGSPGRGEYPSAVLAAMHRFEAAAAASSTSARTAGLYSSLSGGSVAR